MTCREFIGEMLEYSSGDACDRREELRAHEGECNECAQYLRSYQETSKLCSTALDDPADASCSEECSEDLVRSILDALDRKS
jgi:hypothetical protein